MIASTTGAVVPTQGWRVEPLPLAQNMAGLVDWDMTSADWTPADHELVDAADRLAGELLGPGRRAVDRARSIPGSHFDALADAGLYGAAVGTGPGVFDAVAERLARGCLSTAFVWMQHHGLARRLSSPTAPSRYRDLARELLVGRRRAGIVQAGLLPGTAVLTASGSEEQGWTLRGVSPWCTGWGMVDELLLAARLDSDPATVVWLMVPAAEESTLEVTPLVLQAVDATATVRLGFDDFVVPPDRFLGFDAFATVGHAAGRGLRSNGSLALGLAGRCGEMMFTTDDPEAIDAAKALARRVDRVRASLDAADDESLPTARAEAGVLAVDAARLLVTAVGASAAIRGSAAEQVMREAAFLLVFGSRPSIRRALLEQR